MKIVFRQLQTSKEKISVDFDNGKGWQDYAVNDARENGIQIPNSCKDYSKIKIKGSSAVFNNMDVIASVQAGTPDEYISCDVDIDVGCGWNWHGPKLNLSSGISEYLEDNLYVDLGSFYSISSLEEQIPFEKLGITDDVYETTYIDGNYYKVLNTYADNVYVYDSGSGLYLEFGDRKMIDLGSGLKSFSQMLEGYGSNINITIEEGEPEIILGDYAFSLTPPKNVKSFINFDFPSNTVFQLTPTGVENEFTSELGTIINDSGDYVGTGDYEYLHLEESEDGFIINTDYYENNNYIITDYNSFTCVYAGPYTLDLSSLSTQTEHSLSEGEVYSELCKKDIYLYDGYHYLRTNFKLS